MTYENTGSTIFISYKEVQVNSLRRIPFTTDKNLAFKTKRDEGEKERSIKAKSQIEIYQFDCTNEINSVLMFNM